MNALSSPQRTSAAVGQNLISETFNRVQDARAFLAAALRAPQGARNASSTCRAHLLAALEDFVVELELRRLPVPPAIRDDLRLQRRLVPASVQATAARQERA